MPEPRFNTRAHRIVGIIGWVFLVVGLVGVLLAPQFLIAWVVLIGFGAPSAIRAARTWRRTRR